MTRIDTHAPAHAPARPLPADRDKIPRAMVRAMFALVLGVLVIVTFARITDRPLISTPPPGEVVISRHIVLTGDMAGQATVHDADGTLVADLTPEKGGFISGVYRVLVRERTKHGTALDAPVTLLQRDTGRLELHDPSTGWRADLMGFGGDNARAFARLLAQ